MYFKKYDYLETGRVRPVSFWYNWVMSKESSSIESVVLGGGCFWCLEAAYQLVEGVTAITSGYSGGAVKNPGYESVGMGYTGHAEVVKVEFDRNIISFENILEIFWTIHDPTTQNRQGNDVGSQYRSIILYAGDIQRKIAEEVKSQVLLLWSKPIVTEILPLQKFYEAEDYNQNYYKNNSDNGYCEVVINPKLAKLREKFASHLKRDAA